MNEEELAKQKCVPCEGGTAPLSEGDAKAFLSRMPSWNLNSDSKKISKQFVFKDFAEALAFANKIGAIAEEEGHHPDLAVSWGKVGVELSTHAIGGLSQNDFILGAKIDKLLA